MSRLVRSRWRGGRYSVSGNQQRCRAIEEFVQYGQANEPDTRMYVAWQQKHDPTRFVHFFIFDDEAAHKVHSQSEAVERFEALIALNRTAEMH